MQTLHPTPQYKRILVPTDGSDGARHAAEAAVELAHISGGHLIALHVLLPGTTDAESLGMTGMVGLTPLQAALIEPLPRGEDAALAAVEGAARHRGVSVESGQVVDAEPGRAIAETAEHMHCDLIVMSSHGYGRALSALAGSTNATVVSECSVPMLVVQ